MRWYEYKMEVDDVHAPDDLKEKLLARRGRRQKKRRAEICNSARILKNRNRNDDAVSGLCCGKGRGGGD